MFVIKKAKYKKLNMGMSKMITFGCILLCTLLFLPGCGAPSNSSPADFQLEMELTKDYDDADPFVNESLFTVTESVDSLDLAATFTMKGGSGVLEIADNQTEAVLWSDQWEENIENSTFTIPLTSLEKDGEYVVRFTGTEIEYAKVLVTCDSDLIQTRDRPEKTASAQPAPPEGSEQPVETETPGEEKQVLNPLPGKEQGASHEASPNSETKPEPEGPPESPAASGPAEEAAQVEMYMEQRQYPLDAESVRVFISNKGSQNLGYDAYYSLEYLEGESWQEVAADSELTIEDWAGILSPGKEISQTIDLAPYAGKLQAGHYRIVKTIAELAFYAPFELV